MLKLDADEKKLHEQLAAAAADYAKAAELDAQLQGACTRRRSRSRRSGWSPPSSPRAEPARPRSVLATSQRVLLHLECQEHSATYQVRTCVERAGGAGPVTWGHRRRSSPRRQWSSPSPPDSRRPVTALLLLHLLAAVLAPVLVRWWGRQAFLVLALVPAAAFGWLLAQLADGHRRRRGPARRRPWVPALDLQISLRLDALSLTFALLVTGVGALVLVYCARYFEPGDDGSAGSPARSSRSPARCSAWSSPTTCSCCTSSGS